MNYITFRNGKLKKDGIAVFKLPAGKTCPFQGECAEWCYATVGAYRFPVVEQFMKRSFDLTRSDGFVEEISEEIQYYQDREKLDILRLHSSGDFYNQEYFDQWLEITTKFPDTVFYAYTKSLPYIRWEMLPDNFIIIQSYGGRLDDKIDKSRKHAIVFPTKEALEEAGYVDGSESDCVAIDPDNIKIGLIAHGVKSVYVKE